MRSWTHCGSREGSHARRRRHRSRSPTATDGRGGSRHHTDWPAWRGEPSRRVRATSTAHRVLFHVAHGPPRAGAVRRMHLGYHAGPRAVLSSLSRRHLRRVLPGAVRRERPLSRLYGLGDALILSSRLARDLVDWTPSRQDAYSVLPPTRIQVFETYWTTARGVEVMAN